jgi:hypothetical protein
MGTPPGWGLEHRASNPVSVKNLTVIETSTIVKDSQCEGPLTLMPNSPLYGMPRFFKWDSDDQVMEM